MTTLAEIYADIPVHLEFSADKIPNYDPIDASHVTPDTKSTRETEAFDKILAIGFTLPDNFIIQLIKKMFKALGEAVRKLPLDKLLERERRSKLLISYSPKVTMPLNEREVVLLFKTHIFDPCLEIMKVLGIRTGSNIIKTHLGNTQCLDLAFYKNERLIFQLK